MKSKYLKKIYTYIHTMDERRKQKPWRSAHIKQQQKELSKDFMN